MRNIYLDNNATTQVAPEVIEALTPFLTQYWGNPSSMHFFGGQVQRNMEIARGKVSDMLGADASEIIFTSCGTESDNMAIRGTADASDVPMRIITTRVEHLAVLAPCRYLEEKGHELIELGVDASGQIDLEELRKAVNESPRPVLVSIMWANNETGVVFPMEKIAEIVKAAGGVLHTDAVQVAGKMPVDLRSVPIDLLSISGHKLHAPKGIGALYIRKGTRINPFMLGGHQEHGRRGGTENIPYVVGLGVACELATQHLQDERTRVPELRDRLESGLLERCDKTHVNGDLTHRLPNTSSISFQFIEGEAILYHLSDLGIAASSGSACTSGSLEPSHVTRAMGVPFTSAHGTIRFSLSRYNTAQEVDYVLEAVPPIITKLRALSPFC